MTKYLITYDLKNKNVRSYEKLFAAIKSAGTSWWHYLDSTWIIKSNLSSQSIYNLLAPHLLRNDFILVTKIDNMDKQGWLPQGAWNWLNSD